jgi:hypothetical protein
MNQAVILSKAKDLMLPKVAATLSEHVSNQSVILSGATSSVSDWRGAVEGPLHLLHYR